MADRPPAGGRPGAAPAAGAAAAAAAAELPSDAVAVRGVLRSMGAEEAEPRVLAMLLDFVYSYTADVLQDAERYAEALGRPPGAVELPELSFSMQGRAGAAFCQPPPQDVMQKLAEEVNAVDLPEFPLRHGLRLPPNDQSLVMPNWELAPPGAAGATGQLRSGGARQQQQQQQQAQGGGRGGGSGGGAAAMDLT